MIKFDNEKNLKEFKIMGESLSKKSNKKIYVFCPDCGESHLVIRSTLNTSEGRCRSCGLKKFWKKVREAGI